MMGSKKECEQCGSDISGRHTLTRFCNDCAAIRSRAASKRYAQTSSRAAAHEAVRSITRTAVRVGFLPDPRHLDCVDCGGPAECYDHRDYNKPLDVNAVCLRCNSSRGAGVELQGIVSVA